MFIRKEYILFFIVFLIFLSGCMFNILTPEINVPYNSSSQSYPIHKNITVTIFWIGEEATSENGYIANTDSAWDDMWMEHYGGTDDPNNRNGYFPEGFIPHENPFYFALPYNDFKNGKRKPDAYNTVYWSREKVWGPYESMCKNRWIRIVKKGKVVYAQWEDVGPFGEDDKEYVFGNALPKNPINNHAGLDVSPAVRDFLGLLDIDKVDWQFVDESDVPFGPWKEIVTTSQIYWK